jgi:hypothetical protein
VGANVLATERLGELLAAMIAANVFFCIGLENSGPRTANAFELLQFDSKTGLVADKNSFKSQVGDGWLTLKIDGTVWNMDAPGAAPSYDQQLFNSASLLAEPAPLQWNQLPAPALADTRATVSLWDDRVRWTSRQAASSYMPIPSINTAQLTQSFDNTATSQRLDTTIWKAGSTSLSLFGEYDRVGLNFQSPNFAIKPQDPFSTPNSNTTRLGGAFQQGPITFP